MAWLWSKIVRFGRWILTAILLAAVIIAGILISRDQSEDAKTTESTRPEVTQVFEPSIGTPIPADTNENTPPASTPPMITPPTAATPEQPAPTGSVAGATTTYRAPNAGVDPRKPVVYINTNYQFTATLPAGSSVKEDGTVIGFFSITGALLYTVTVQSNTDSLSSVEAQLRNSPGIHAITSTTFGNLPALSFKNGSASGLVFIKNGTAYYLMGQSSYFSQFKI